MCMGEPSSVILLVQTEWTAETSQQVTRSKRMKSGNVATSYRIKTKKCMFPAINSTPIERPRKRKLHSQRPSWPFVTRHKEIGERIKEYDYEHHRTECAENLEAEVTLGAVADEKSDWRSLSTSLVSLNGTLEQAYGEKQKLPSFGIHWRKGNYLLYKQQRNVNLRYCFWQLSAIFMNIMLQKPSQKLLRIAFSTQVTASLGYKNLSWIWRGCIALNGDSFLIISVRIINN